MLLDDDGEDDFRTRSSVSLEGTVNLLDRRLNALSTAHSVATAEEEASKLELLLGIAGAAHAYRRPPAGQRARLHLELIFANCDMS
jgi:hypothetical protein